METRSSLNELVSPVETTSAFIVPRTDWLRLPLWVRPGPHPLRWIEGHRGWGSNPAWRKSESKVKACRIPSSPMIAKLVQSVKLHVFPP